ncbi:hypothetical protein b3_0127 [Synechococcus phage B3]|nr:hypothetical protein b3_0127 [Synechococcus phage B3]QGT54741.1 hypothetical protein b23_0126 [Synechococcus phage B23]
MNYDDLCAATQAVEEAFRGPWWLEYQVISPERVRLVAAIRALVKNCVYVDDYGTEYISPEDIIAIAAQLENN